MMMAGAYAPPISLFSVLPEKRETGRARSKEKRERRREFDRRGQISPKYGGCSQTVPGNLAVSIQVRLTPFRPEPLRRICGFLRGCFASLTQGP